MDPARRTLYALSATYLLSGVILWRVHAKQRDVWLWVLTGGAGFVLTAALDRDRPLVWIGLLVALGPQMLSATWGDLRRGNRLLTIVDVGGLITLTVGLALGRQALGL